MPRKLQNIPPRRRKPAPAPVRGHRLQEEIARARRTRDFALEQALQRWDELPQAIQAGVVREIAETRHQELRRAYPDILGIAYGSRSRRGVTLEDECVTFLVARKWSRKEQRAASPGAHLPRVLWTYAPAAWTSERVLCAVPTDVESVSDGVPVPHGAGIAMFSPERNPNTGSVACAVRVPGDEQPHALTCYHVAAMPDPGGGVPAQAPRAMLRDGAAGLGLTWWKWCGTLEPPGPLSLDAAVLRVAVAQQDTLRKVTEGFRASFPLENAEAIPNACQILVPGRQPVVARYKQTWINYDLIGYFNSASQPVHRVVLEFELNDLSEATAGDSGSAVVNSNGNQFVGLYIAGVPDSPRRFVLPAYHVLDGSLYGNQGRLTLVPNP